ncbi:hypothetical protein QYE76_019508 [Lolium multiflorum]|uniref:Uncharacterized protein n=1 Tax=Lolium multiflorum TaxID=4521 RepID=A0AAD8R4N1_LOLMU|nr:hypothetical protein QYE76_019508 [Lolium multiflorum]
MAGSTSPARSTRLAAATVASGRGGWSSSSCASMSSVVDIHSSPVEVVEVFEVPSDSTTGTVVLPASSTGTVVLAASPPRSPASPTSVLRVAPLTLVRGGVCFNMGFKEEQMKKVAADVLAFAGVHVTSLQLYNHIRNWRTKWSVITKMKFDRILDWSEAGCCFYGGDEGAADEYSRAIDFIADNEAEYAAYHKLPPPERRSWLRTWFRNQFPA